MWEEDTVVPVARWEPDADVDAIAAVRDGLDAFAGSYGMSAAARADVRAAASEAVADAVVRIRRTDEPGCLVVNAATDGIWLSVTVTADAVERGPRAEGSLPLGQCLADRLEWSADARGTHLLLEFAMGTARPAATFVPHSARRRRGAVRRRLARRPG